MSVLSVLCASCRRFVTSVLSLRSCVQCAEVLSRSYILHPIPRNVFDSTSPSRGYDRAYFSSRVCILMGVRKKGNYALLYITLFHIMQEQ